VDHQRPRQPVAQPPRQRVEGHQQDAEDEVEAAHQAAGEQGAGARAPPLGRHHAQRERQLAGRPPAGRDLEAGEIPPVEQEDADGEERRGRRRRQPADQEGDGERPQEEQHGERQIVEERGERAAAQARHRQVEADVVQPQDALNAHVGQPHDSCSSKP